MLSTDLVILSDGAELEGLADAPDTAADTVGQDLHLSLLSSPRIFSVSAEANLHILQLTPGLSIRTFSREKR